MIFYASKNHDVLNGEPFVPEDYAEGLCLNPYYPAHPSRPVPYLLDSGAFQDVKKEARLTPAAALDRQLAYEKTVGYPAEAVVSYDRLVDEQCAEGVQFKDRVSEAQGREYVAETIAAAEYLASQRERLAPRHVVLSCQGTTVPQYLDCVRQVLTLSKPGDILGLGGFCIISRGKKYEQQFYEVIRQAFPLIKAAGLTRVHIFGVGILRVLVRAEMMACPYGLELSYDTSSYEVNAVFGRMFDPNAGALTGIYDKSEKYTEYTPASLALFNIRLITEFWRYLPSGGRP